MATMNQAEQISIIVPMYNAEEYIAETLTSIQKQTYDNFEVILVNDGSTDRTESIVKQFADARFQLISGENHGASYARNSGLIKARGAYILFFDADDRMYPNMLENLINGILASGADLAIANHDVIDEMGNPVRQVVAPKGENLLLTSNESDLMVLSSLHPFPDTKLYKTDIVRNNGILFPATQIGEDLNFYLKYLLCSKKVWQTEQVVCSYRVRNGSISHKANLKAMMGITESFDDVAQFYKKNNATDDFVSMLINQRVRHCIYQSNNWPRLATLEEKRKLLGAVHREVVQVETRTPEVLTRETILKIRYFNRTWRRRWFYLSQLHEWLAHLKRKTIHNE